MKEEQQEEFDFSNAEVIGESGKPESIWDEDSEQPNETPKDPVAEIASLDDEIASIETRIGQAPSGYEENSNRIEVDELKFRRKKLYDDLTDEQKQQVGSK